MVRSVRPGEFTLKYWFRQARESEMQCRNRGAGGVGGGRSAPPSSTPDPKVRTVRKQTNGKAKTKSERRTAAKAEKQNHKKQKSSRSRKAAKAEKQQKQQKQKSKSRKATKAIKQQKQKRSKSRIRKTSKMNTSRKNTRPSFSFS